MQIVGNLVFYFFGLYGFISLIEDIQEIAEKRKEKVQSPQDSGS